MPHRRKATEASHSHGHGPHSAQNDSHIHHYDVNVTVRPDPKVFEPIIQEAAARHGVDPALIRAVMRFESAFRPLAVSQVGASGLMPSSRRSVRWQCPRSARPD